MEIDLHGHHFHDLNNTGSDETESVLIKIVRQAWEMGEPTLTLIHGHGRKRGPGPYRVNTNTGYFGLRIRSKLRHDGELRKWIKYTTLDCGHSGSTTVKLKRNPTPSRRKIDPLPQPRYQYAPAL
jgi:hypothetical protein